MPDPVIVQSLIPVIDPRMIMCQINDWSSVGLIVAVHVVLLDVVVDTLHRFLYRLPLRFIMLNNLYSGDLDRSSTTAKSADHMHWTSKHVALDRTALDNVLSNAACARGLYFAIVVHGAPTDHQCLTHSFR